MIRFLKKIRIRLLKQGQTKKYLLYAIGEIFLIVVGILIALQVNNINSKYQEKKRENVILSELEKNLIKDFKGITFDIETYATAIKACEQVLKNLNNDTRAIDSLGSFYFNLLLNAAFAPNVTTYENLKSFGIDKVSNDKIREQITQLYSEKYTFLSRIEQDITTPYFFITFVPSLQENLETDRVRKKAWPVNFKSLSKNHLFKEQLKTRIRHIEYMINYNIGVKKMIQNLIFDIEKEIPSSFSKSKLLFCSKDGVIYAGNKQELGLNYFLGSQNFEGRANWVYYNADSISVEYPGSQKWGVFFVALGPNNSPTTPTIRPFKDFSKFKRLTLEVRGKDGGEKISISMKDRLDLDGSENKISLTLEKEWKIYHIELTDFSSANQKDIYIPLQIHFGKASSNLYIRHICFS